MVHDLTLVTNTEMFVKICGVTTEEDALLAVAMGADAVGFNFVAGSKRQVTPTVVADIVKRLPPEVLTVGVFRDELPERVVEIVQRTGLNGAQLHGHETPAQALFVAERVAFTIQAFAAGDPTIDRARDYPVSVIMLDNPTPGSGQVFDWSLTDGVPDGKPLLLAGGLTPRNVGDAIARVRPWGVDVASGVEAEPGRKDPRKVRAFVANAKRAARTQTQYEPLDDPPYDWQEDP
jgi:phosphoribosylanthranilate isomerase